MNQEELRERLIAYLRLREALGTPVGTDSKMLDHFIAFATAQEDCDRLTSKVVFDWLDATTGAHPGVATRRLSLVRQFLLHLSASYPDTQVPTTHLIGSRRRPTPFVLTESELELLLKGAAELKKPFLSLVIHTALGLIASTGLRASEAIGLDCSDVELQGDRGSLLIRESKFDKSRIVPLHSSTAEHVGLYAHERDRCGASLKTTAFFVNHRGRALTYSLLRKCFGEIVNGVGIHPHEGGKQPTLHSLRHSFVVSRLRSWHEQGVDVQSRLMHLSMYLGHVDVRDTYWYMTATPELLSAAVADFTPPDGERGQQ